MAQKAVADIPLELIIVRHGESEANVGRSADPDCELTPNGLQQAKDLAARMRHWQLEGFRGLVSPYRRTRHTAEPITAATGITFEVNPQIREWGPNATVSGVHYPTETVEDLIARLEAQFYSMAGRWMIISHAAPIAIMTQYALGQRCYQTQGEFWIPVQNCCARHIICPADRPRHLPLCPSR